jgi:subtilisin family serine protease
MKPLLTLISGSLLVVAAVADPTTRCVLLNAAIGAAWAQQDRGRGHEDREDSGPGKHDKDEDADRDKDRGPGKHDKDKDEDSDRDSGPGSGKPGKDKDEDSDRDSGPGPGKHDKDKDKDEDADRDSGPGPGKSDKDEDADGDSGPGPGKPDKDETPGGDDGPGSGNVPDLQNPRDDRGSNGDNAAPVRGGAEIANGGAEPAERGPDQEREGDLGALASRFNLDDTETFDDDGFLARRGEIIALSADAALSRRAAALGLQVIEQQVLTSLHGTMYRLSVPAASPIDGVLARLRAQDPDGVFDRNHLYDRSAANSSSSSTPISATAPSRALLSTASGISIGLIDTGVDVLHPALQGSHVELQYFVDGSGVLPEAHGTAVASLFVSPRFGLLPDAQLYVASVFYEDRRGGSLSEAQDLVRALDWLMERRVPVINMSLSGPPNEVLRAAIKRAIAAGHLIVAAVGNAGPASQPLYPAAYEGVIGVTAVDLGQHVFRRANRGAYVEFAAVGVDVIAAAPGGLAAFSGTSFASPYVAALAAMEYRSLDPREAIAARESLRSHALDLGKPGRDEIYGFGLARPRTISTAAR